MELQELAQRIRRGDRDALKSLISEYGVGIYQKAYQKTQDKVLAREATRQTFAQLVTALQEQTDMDGWELWLNALAKKNIDTYCNIGADMAYLENQLDTALFSPNAQVPPNAQSVASAAQAEAAKRFAMQQQMEAQRQYEAQQAQLLAKQEAQRQYEAQQAQLLAKQEAQRQYEAQQAQLLAEQEAQRQYDAQRQYEAQVEARQIAAEPIAQPVETPAAPAAQQEQANRLPERKKSHRRERLIDGEKPRAGSTWPVIVLLILLCIVLVWLVLGVVMSLGWLPKFDLGYAWFNENIIVLF